MLQQGVLCTNLPRAGFGGIIRDDDSPKRREQLETNRREKRILSDMTRSLDWQDRKPSTSLEKGRQAKEARSTSQTSIPYYAAALFRLAHRAFKAALIRFRAAAERRRRPLLPLLPGVVPRRAEIAFSRRSRSAVNSSIIDCVFMGVSPNFSPAFYQ